MLVTHHTIVRTSEVSTIHDIATTVTFDGGEVVTDSVATGFVRIESNDEAGHRVSLGLRNDDATRSVLRRVLAAMGTELVSKDHTPTPTPPVCDHCGEPVEPTPGGIYWTHPTESRPDGQRFGCIVYGKKMHTDATVNGSDWYSADLVPDPS